MIFPSRYNGVPEICCFFIILLLISYSDLNAEMNLRGFADSYHAVRTREPHDYLSSRTRVRVETQFENNDAVAFVSFNAVHNDVVTEETGFELREAYAEYAQEWWDIRAGRQIIIWGKADGLQITDIISPKDYSEFMARDFDDMRLPVDAMKARLLSDIVNLEVILIPIFRESVLPTEDNPWAVEPEFPSNVNVTTNEPEMPEKKLGNGEVAAKVSLCFSGFDFAVSYFYTWDDLPAMHRTDRTVGGTDTDITIQPEYGRITFVGLEFSMSIGEFVFRGEGAFFRGRYFEPEDIMDDLLQKDTVNGLLGIDWNPGSGWSISTQFADIYILKYDDSLYDDKHTMYATLSISKKLFRETLTISTNCFYGLNEKDVFDRTSIDYALTDELHVLIGADIFAGGEKGQFGQYRDNTEVWGKVKYSF